MNAQEIKQIIADISRTKWQLENALEENGGELTEELLAQVDNLEDMKALLSGEGIDDLGRWLKSVQDEIAARKAEADAAARKVKNLKGYEDYVKSLIGQAIDALDLPTNDKGEKVAKGAFYGFKRTSSTKSQLDAEALDAAYLDLVTEAARNAGLPSCIDVALKTNVTRLNEAGGQYQYYVQETTSPSLSFSKPRANKKEE